MSHQFHLLKYIQQNQQNSLKYCLNITIDDKNAKLLNIVGKVILDLIVPLVKLIPTSIVIIAIIITYFDPDTNYSLLLTIFWAIVTYICWDQGVSVFWAGLILASGTTYTLIIKFRKINDKIKICVKQNKNDFIRYNLIDLIEEHNYFTKITADINKTFRIGMFIIHFSAIPSFSLLFYCMHHRDVKNISKFIGGIGSIVAFIPLFLFPIFCARLINAAHSPYVVLLTYFSRIATSSSKKTRLKKNFKTMIKVMSYMERLSGPDIGFYCYDLFPMNWWEFYQLVAISVSNYFLIISLF